MVGWICWGAAAFRFCFDYSKAGLCLCFVSRLAIFLITNLFPARHALVVANLVVVVVVEHVVLVLIYQSVYVKLSYVPMVVKFFLRRRRYSPERCDGGRFAHSLMPSSNDRGASNQVQVVFLLQSIPSISSSYFLRFSRTENQKPQIRSHF